MTIDEAIKILEYNVNTHPQKEDKPFCSAIKLGIEALKVIRKLKSDPRLSAYTTLPGETEE